MVFAVGFMLGFLLAYLPSALPRRKKTAEPPRDEEAQRRAARALREYRNFLTYDGYADQGE